MKSLTLTQFTPAMGVGLLVASPGGAAAQRGRVDQATLAAWPSLVCDRRVS